MEGNGESEIGAVSAIGNVGINVGTEVARDGYCLNVVFGGGTGGSDLTLSAKEEKNWRDVSKSLLKDEDAGIVLEAGFFLSNNSR